MSYLKAYMLTIIVGGLCVFTFNWVVDPYHLNGRVRLPQINAYKPEYDNHMMLSKAYEIRRIKPNNLILGTSRAGDGLPPNHPGFRENSGETYNMSLDGANIGELSAYFKHATHLNPLDKVVLGLDLFAFNVELYSNRSDFNPEILEPNSTPATVAGTYAKAYFSAQTFGASIETILQQKKDLVTPLKLGMRSGIDYERAFQRRGARGTFEWVIRHFAKTAYFPPPKGRFALRNGQFSSIDDFRDILDHAARHRIKLYLVILPMHAWDLEAIRSYGLWPSFEDWKRRLLTVVEQHNSASPSERPSELWDFSGYRWIALEPVPAASDREHRMTWWLDAMHFNQRAGNVILDRVLRSNAPHSPANDTIGFRLSSQNLEPELAAIRSEGLFYRQQHPNELAELESWIESYVGRGAK